MDRETYEKSVVGPDFRDTPKAKLSVVSVGCGNSGVDLYLSGNTTDSVKAHLPHSVAKDLAPAYGEELVVEIRRPTGDEKLAAKVQEALETFGELLRTKNVAKAVNLLSVKHEVRGQLDLLEELVRREVPGMVSGVDEFFQAVRAGLADKEAE